MVPPAHCGHHIRAARTASAPGSSPMALRGTPFPAIPEKFGAAAMPRLALRALLGSYVILRQLRGPAEVESGPEQWGHPLV